MKILSLCIVLTTVICTSSPALAANLGSPIRPLGHLEYAVGLEDNFVFEREIQEGGTFSDGTTMTTFEIKEMNQGYVKGVVGILDYFNLYAKGGVVKIKKGEINTADGAKRKFETDDIGPFCGIGITGVYEFGDGWLIGGDAEYNAFWCDLEELKVNEGPADELSGELQNQEYQVAIFGGKKFDILDGSINIIPYVGGIYSYFNSKTDGDINYIWDGTSYAISYDLDGKEDWGGLVGVDVEMSESINLNVEGEFITETAITVCGIFKF